MIYVSYFTIQVGRNPMLLMPFLYSLRRRQWQPTPVLLPGKSHGWRSLEGCSPWDRWGSDTTEPLHFHFSLSCTGEGNGNPLQCSCLENPRDRGAWWAAVYGVAQSRTRLKRLGSFIDVRKENCRTRAFHFYIVLAWESFSMARHILDFPSNIWSLLQLFYL